MMKSEIVRRTRGWRRARRLESEDLVVEMRGVVVGMVGGMEVGRDGRREIGSGNWPERTRFGFSGSCS